MYKKIHFSFSEFSRHSALLLRKQTTEKGCHDLGNPTSSNSKIQQSRLRKVLWRRNSWDYYQIWQVFSHFNFKKFFQKKVVTTLEIQSQAIPKFNRIGLKRFYGKCSAEIMIKLSLLILLLFLFIILRVKLICSLW